MPRELEGRRPDPGEESAFKLGQALGQQLYGNPLAPQIARSSFTTEREIEQRPDGTMVARERESIVDEFYPSLLQQHLEPPSGGWLRRLLGD